ncbi:50S ribosomal protein L11 methyltransferase [Alkaliphilus serpentinus]|uniref:Ribosomal protein L11 methyltransferase n=1 Tax=Alkaliphilus serpentinus TaxID=1482731 RepID=A0A833M9U0_9FIRM|nr:50S ribosomal protein L11 methyltransferase [Alkaliphilus serpentinus]KAB3530745.1 50S ribosomal protein L11 methyltransferase [Alkaliphilus serpentinus]
MKWTEVAIKTTTEAVEAVTNILYDAGANGVAIEDPKDFLFMKQEETSWDYVDEALLIRDYEGAIVKGYLPASADLVDKIELIRKSVELLPQFGLDIGIGEITTIEVSEEDWSSAWKQYYKPVKISDKIVIKPTWEEYQSQGDEIILELDPGMAFGTGTHETTVMCIQAQEKYVKGNSKVFDIGCGSGILSIAAAKLGASKVIAVDLDATAVAVAEKNVAINGVEDIVTIKHGNLMDTINERADIVVANIIADIIILLSKEISSFMEEEGVFIASGIITEKMDLVKEELIANGLEIIEVNQMGEWAAIISKKKGENHE